MPLAALVNGEERIAPLLSDVEWQVLKDFAAAGSLKVATTCCHAPAEPISVKGGYRYFKAPECTHFKDTTDTLAVETALLKGIVSSGWSVRCNVIGGGSQAWTADILATSPDGECRVAFIVEPAEPKVSALGEYVIRSSRMAESGIAAIFIFPSIPNDGMWKFVHEGKLITVAKYVPGQAMVAGLDAALFATVALKKKPVVRIGKIRSFHIRSWARPGRTDGTETYVYARGTEYESPLGPNDFVVGFSVSYMGEELESFEWGWGANSDVMEVLTARNEPVGELLLLSAEICALNNVIGHFAGARGRFHQARSIASGIVIETSGNPRMNSVLDDLLRGGFKEKYYSVYPRFVYLMKKDLLEMKRSHGYVIARTH